MIQKSRKSPIFLHDQKRLALLSFFVFCLFSILILQFFKLQIIEGEKWAKKAKVQHQFVIKDNPKRGVFYSQSYLKDMPPKALVIDIPMFHLYIDPRSIPDDVKEEMSVSLLNLLELSKDEKNYAKEQFHKDKRSRKVAMWISHESKATIEKWWSAYSKKNKIVRNAIYFVQDYKRSYPYGKLLGQVLQTVRDDKDETTQAAIPTGGLELAFHSYLQGKEGLRMLWRSPKYPLDRGAVIKKPLSGADVYLTIDAELQVIAEEEVEKAVKYASAIGGWAIIMNPDSGEILALAQYPFFYPHDYRKYYNDQKLQETIKVKAITDCFEPGSVMKPFSMAIALKANQEMIKLGKSPLFKPDEMIDLQKVKFPGRKNPMKDLATARYLNMDLAIQKSSNIYMAGVIQKVVDAFGPEWYREQLSECFGFGKKTHIELPSETSGFLPTPGKCYPNGKLQWSVPTSATIAIGYNLLTNSIQLVRAYAILANGGYDVKPTLLKKIIRESPDGQEIIYDNSEKIIKRRVIDSAIISRVVRAMKYVTKVGGSASRADVPGFTEVGKTSSTEKLKNGAYDKKCHIATFCGFVPVSRPRFVILVAIDEPEFRYLPGVGRTHYGGKCAAPAFRELAKRSLQYLGETPDDPYGYPQGDPRFDEEKADWMKEVKLLKQQFLHYHQP